MSKLPSSWHVGEEVAIAAADLSQIADLLEENGDLDYALLKVFGEKQALQAQAVDRNFVFNGYVKSLISMAKEMEQDWKNKRYSLERVMEAHKQRLKEIVEANNKIPFQGKQGKIALQKSPAAMNMVFPTVKKTFELVDEIHLDGLDEQRLNRYFPEVLIRTVDKEMIKSDLKDGTMLPFATLTQDNHVRFRV